MTRKMLAIVGLLLAGLWLGGMEQASQAHPEPSIVQRHWQYDFTFDAPRPIAVRDVTTGELRWYWYMTYKVVNNTGETRLFVPNFTILTDEGDIIQAGAQVPGTVFEAVKKRVDNHLLESPQEVLGRILQGEDHAKESAAIWPATRHHVSRLWIFVEGLSGETVTVPHPTKTKKNEDGQAVPVNVLLSKTLQITVAMPGKPQTPQDQTVQVEGQDWVMR